MTDRSRSEELDDHLIFTCCRPSGVSADSAALYGQRSACKHRATNFVLFHLGKMSRNSPKYEKTFENFAKKTQEQNIFTLFNCKKSSQIWLNLKKPFTQMQ